MHGLLISLLRCLVLFQKLTKYCKFDCFNFVVKFSCQKIPGSIKFSPRKKTKLLILYAIKIKDK